MFVPIWLIVVVACLFFCLIGSCAQHEEREMMRLERKHREFDPYLNDCGEDC